MNNKSSNNKLILFFLTTLRQHRRQRQQRRPQSVKLSRALPRPRLSSTFVLSLSCSLSIVVVCALCFGFCCCLWIPFAIKCVNLVESGSATNFGSSNTQITKRSASALSVCACPVAVPPSAPPSLSQISVDRRRPLASRRKVTHWFELRSHTFWDTLQMIHAA